MKIIIEKKDFESYKIKTSRRICIIMYILNAFRLSHLLDKEIERELERILMYLENVDRQLMMEIEGIVEGDF